MAGALHEVPLTDDLGGAAAFMMSNLSVRREGEGELVRSLGADEIKRDDLAIHASARRRRWRRLTLCLGSLFLGRTGRMIFSSAILKLIFKEPVDLRGNQDSAKIAAGTTETHL